jgi:hypothetical protein
LGVRPKRDRDMKVDILVTLALVADILFLGYTLNSFLQGPRILTFQPVVTIPPIDLATFVYWATSWPANLAIALMMAGLLFLGLRRSPTSNGAPNS